MAIKVRYRQLKQGYVTPYFEINHAGKRWYEPMTLLKHKGKPQSIAERVDANEKKDLLKRALRERELEIVMGEYDIKSKYNNKIDFFEYLDEYIKNYPNKGDARAYTSMQKQLKLFVKKPKLYAFEIDEAFVRRFVKHLETNLNFETPLTYFKKFKKVLRLATKQKIFKNNPAEDVVTKKHKTREKEILSPVEIKNLKETHCFNRQVKNAFLFAFFTGLRFVDINRLTWRNIEGTTLKITQSKTGVAITIPIHNSALEFLGERQSPDDFVFNLPSHTGCLKAIRKWVKDAEIQKHITFHCARHSLGSNLVANGVDISVAARLLGHTSLKHTMRYVRTSEALKQSAINTLPTL